MLNEPSHSQSDVTSWVDEERAVDITSLICQRVLLPSRRNWQAGKVSWQEPLTVQLREVQSYAGGEQPSAPVSAGTSQGCSPEKEPWGSYMSQQSTSTPIRYEK